MFPIFSLYFLNENICLKSSIEWTETGSHQFCLIEFDLSIHVCGVDQRENYVAGNNGSDPFLILSSQTKSVIDVSMPTQSRLSYPFFRFTICYQQVQTIDKTHTLNIVILNMCAFNAHYTNVKISIWFAYVRIKDNFKRPRKATSQHHECQCPMYADFGFCCLFGRRNRGSAKKNRPIDIIIFILAPEQPKSIKKHVYIK